MRRTQRTPEQVINTPGKAETMLAGDRMVAQLLQHLGVSEATFNRWHKSVQRDGERGGEASEGAGDRERSACGVPR
jgi:hypothetical protein